EIVNWGSLNAQDYFGYDNIKDYITVSLLENGTDLIYEELNILAQISNTLGETALSNNIHDLLLDYWQNYVQEFISESNDFTEYYSLSDEDSLKSRAKDCISELLAESTLSFTASEVDDIITNLDANNIIERNIENEAPDWERDEYDRHYINQDDGFDAVDDLFSIN
ncbi:hypothetical protein J5H79_18325, partial [Providencia rettgeri]|nr:hypothetical protein [Providencia rettgeri]